MGRRRILTLAAGLSTTLALLGCTTTEEPPDLEREPKQASAELDAIDASDLQLPLIVEPLELVEPGWDLDVKHLGDVFLSARSGDERLDFSAVDSNGTTLWQAQRPTGCTGFTMTLDSEGQPLAVLTDSASDETCTTEVTASAYDLESGEQRWGPTEVPGPMQGPGAVFSSDDGDEAVALDPDTGETAEESSTSRVLGEFQGTILSVDEDTLSASDEGKTTWKIPLSDHDWNADGLTAFPDQTEGLIHLDAKDGSGPVIDAESGDILDDSASEIARDANSEMIITRDPQGLTVIDAAGTNELPVSLPKSVVLEAAVGGLIYLREGETLRVHNAATGSIARGYPAEGSGVVAVPDAFTSKGLGTLRAGDRTLLATDRVVEESAEGQR
ncbi:PQQ-binding-like beta-propeller repeat protein [Brevibacterium sp. CBA3109]|uniref:PQQ-binding-like beta-propeller repeat protein n=1 Tax=Brevibacterium koreense TaxID=3140787 RepID=A0AAU7UI99_9MICO